MHFLAGQTVDIYGNEVPAPNERSLRSSWEEADLGLDAGGLDAAIQYASDVRDRIHTDLNGGAPDSAQDALLNFLGLTGLLNSDVSSGQVLDKILNLGRFSRAIHDWETVNPIFDQREFYQGFTRFLYYDAENAYRENPDDSRNLIQDAVQVMTVHKAKGKEWPVVFIPALTSNRFPSESRENGIWKLIPRKAIENPERYNGSIEDERRLFYVAMTRSKKFLHMTCAPDAKGKNSRTSEFWVGARESTYVRTTRPDYGKRRRLPTPALNVSTSGIEIPFSDLVHLLDCRYRYKLQAVYGFAELPDLWTGYGRLLHDALAEVHRKAMRGEFMSVSDAPDLFIRHYRPSYARGRQKEELEKRARGDIANYIRDNRARFQQITYAEQPVEFSLGDGISVTGRMDLVRRSDSGEVTIVDMKSSEKGQRDRVTNMQLHVYAMGYRELTGLDADFVETYYIRERRSRRRMVDHNLISSLTGRIRSAVDDLSAMQLKPSPSEAECGRCDFRELCPASVASSRAGAPTAVR